MFQTLRWHPSVAPGLCLVRCVTLYCDPHTLHRTQCYVRGFVRKTCLQNSFICGMFGKCPCLSEDANFPHKHFKPMPREISWLYHNFCLCCMCPIECGMSTVMVWHNYFSYFRSESQWVKVWVKIEVTWPMHRARIIWWTKKLLRDHASIMLEGILWHVISK